MTRTRIALLAFALLGATTASVFASGDMVLFSKWTLPRQCHFKNAIAVGVEDLAKNPAAYKDKCVEVTGYLGFRAVFSSMPAFYALRGSSYDEDSLGVRVGLYADPQTENALFRARRLIVKVVGKAGTCDDLFNAPNKMMVMGYCHYVHGPVMFLSDFALISATPQRLERSQLPEDQIHLEDMPPDDPRAAAVTQIGMRWLDAVRRKDAQMFLSIHEGKSIEDLYDPDSVMHKLFASHRDRYGAIVAVGPTPPFKLLRPISDFLDGPAYGCFCKTNDCSASWPAQVVDARATPAWPYACFSVQEMNGKTEVNTSD